MPCKCSYIAIYTTKFYHELAIVKSNMALLGTLFVVLSASMTIPCAAKLTDLLPRDGLCDLSTNERRDTLRQIQNAADRLQNDGVLVPDCGNGVWIPLADFDVTGTDTECPPGWTFTETPMRGCIGENSNGAGGCDVAAFSTGGFPYNKVCGRITGRTSDGTTGFLDLTSINFNSDPTTTLVDDIVLVDGITLTHSSPIQHIWTFAANGGGPFCPCNPQSPGLRNSPVEFASDNYFCGVDSAGVNIIWDGGCEAFLPGPFQTCCNFNSPPFFVAELATTTSADVDARLCLDGTAGQGDDALLVESIKLYVQ